MITDDTNKEQMKLIIRQCSQYLSWREIEKQALIGHLERHKGNVVFTSESLNLANPTVYAKIKKYKLTDLAGRGKVKHD